MGWDGNKARARARQSFTGVSILTFLRGGAGAWMGGVDGVDADSQAFKERERTEEKGDDVPNIY